jgi:HK97 family phage major capsid protein
MKIAQLEADLNAKQRELAALVENTLRAAESEVVKPATATEPAVVGRFLTAEEKARIKAVQDECAAIKGRIAQAQGDASLVAEIERMTAGIARPPSNGGGTPTRSDRRSIGQQFVADANVRAFLAAGGHRQMGQWTSPTVDAAHWRTLEMMGTTLTEDPASGGALVPPQYLPSLVSLAMRRPVVADLASPGTATSNLIQYMKEKTFTNAADAVKEGALKPESTLVFENASAPVRKIAHWIPVSEEMLEDSDQVASIIDARLRWGVEMKEEDELLNGSGIDPHIHGYLQLPGLAPGVPLGTDTIADAMLKQITAIATTALVMPDGFVMNPNDWLTVQIAKNAQGNYMGAGPWAAPQAPMLWGLSGVVTPAEPAGVGLVGAFRSMSQVFRKGGIRVEASNSHQDFFVKNLVAIRAEERLALAVYREGAFGIVSGLVAGGGGVGRTPNGRTD